MEDIFEDHDRKTGLIIESYSKKIDDLEQKIKHLKIKADTYADKTEAGTQTTFHSENQLPQLSNTTTLLLDFNSLKSKLDHLEEMTTTIMTHLQNKAQKEESDSRLTEQTSNTTKQTNCKKYTSLSLEKSPLSTGKVHSKVNKSLGKNKYSVSLQVRKSNINTKKLEAPLCANNSLSEEKSVHPV